MRRELPLDVCEFFRARDRAREFRFCVMPLSEVFRARCRFASRINSSKTSEYVKQPISICKSLQTVRCLLELEHGYGCSEILPGLLVHFVIGKTARRFERAGVRQRAYYFGVWRERDVSDAASDAWFDAIFSCRFIKLLSHGIKRVDFCYKTAYNNIVLSENDLG